MTIKNIWLSAVSILVVSVMLLSPVIAAQSNKEIIGSVQLSQNNHHSLDCKDYPNAVVCYKFTDQSSVDALFPGSMSRGCSPGPLYDSVEKAGKLVVASECGANSSGTFRFNWKALDDNMWIQFRFKPEKGLIREAAKYKVPHWKMMAIWRGPSSCTDQGFVVANNYYRGFPQFYEACGGYGYKTNVLTNGKLYTYDLQPGGDTHCFYSRREKETKPCFEFRDKWATYTFYFDLNGSRHGGIPTVKGWAQYDGEKRVQFLEHPLKLVRFIEHAYFGPYMTNKDNRIVHPEWAVWYQDFLVTEQALIND